MTLQAPMGGSEILYQALAARVDLSSINLIKSVCAWELLDNRPNVLWQHLNTDEDAVKLLADPQFVARLDKIVFVSDWQKIKFIRTFNLPIHKCVTIRNAIEPIPAHKKPEKIRLIYTSTPWRGLHLLIEAFKVLDRDVELVVYSGTSIYGKDFHEQTKDQFQRLYDELKALDVTHIEYAPNDEVRKALTQAHILAYPNTWEETSCLSAIEALAAGCKVVTTRNGALPETCGDWADYAELKDYVEVLRNAIDNYEYNQDQVDFYNTNYSWDARVEEWRSLIDDVLTNKPRVRRVIIGTPALTGELEVRYVNSLIQAVKLCLTQNIILEPLFVSYDALIQRARNDTLAIALEKGVDALVFIDQDIMFDPEWVLRLINRTEDVVGGTYRKKTDEEELYVVTGNDLTVHTNGLIKVHSLGTGFVKLSRCAMQALWDNSEEYENEGKIRKMICNVSVVNGSLVSEDVMMFKKLNELGFDVWLDPSMTCGHVGTKLFLGDFQDFSNRLSNVMPSKINRL